MGRNQRGNDRDGSGRSILIALSLNLGIIVAQVVGGVLSGSLALLADAAHNGSDAASLGIAYRARQIAQRRANRKYTFGYNRAEVIGALLNLTVLFVVAIYLLWQATSRLINPTTVDGTTMLVVGVIAFVEDALSVWVLAGDGRHKMNVKAVLIHLIGDTLATLGVVIGALLIMVYGLQWIDPALTAAIAVYIFIHAYLEIRKSITLLMDTAPEALDVDEMVQAVERVEGVDDLHHIHVWRIDEDRVALEARVVVTEPDLEHIEGVKHRIKAMLADEFGIGHVTLEMEIAGPRDRDRPVIPEES